MHGLVDRLRIGAGGREVGLATRKAGIGRRSLGRANDQRKGVEHRRIGRRLPGRFDCRGGSARKSLVGVQGHAPMPGRSEECVNEALLPVLLEERGGKPGRLIAVQDLPGFLQIAGIEHVRLRCARPVVGEDQAGHLLQELRVPERLCRRGENRRSRRDTEVLRSGSQPVEERAPGGLRLLLIEALEHHRDVEGIPRAEGDLLTPVGVEQRLAVEGDDPANQPPICVVRCRLDWL